MNPGAELWTGDADGYNCLLLTRHIDDKKMKQDMIETHYLLLFLNDLGVVSYEQVYEDAYEISIPIK
jgi:hypothetical protein